MRIIGYNQLPTTPPLAPITAKLPPESRRSRFAVRRLLAALGYQETINFSFVEESWERDLAGNADPIRLLNPIASQMSVMRSSLLGSLLQVLKFNLDRKAERVRVFELGRVFLRDAAVPTTDSHRARHPPADAGGGPGLRRRRRIAMGRARAPARDFYDVKGDVEALLSPLQAQFKPAEHPALHPGPLRRHLAGRPPGRRSGRAAPALAPELGARRMRRCCSNSTSMPLSQRQVRGLRAGAQVPAGRARHRGDRGRQRHP